MTSRGFRNNNPGNIRKGQDWRGLAAEQPDPAFCTFVAPVYGIRAMVRILRVAYEKRGADTVREIIRAWAPPIENDTDAYVAAVCKSAGVTADMDLTGANREIWAAIIKAIIRHENGSQPYSDNTIDDAMKLAGF